MSGECDKCGEHILDCECIKFDACHIYEAIKDVVYSKNYNSVGLTVAGEELENFILELTGAVYKVLNGMD